MARLMLLKEDKESRKKSKPKIDVVDDYQIPVQMISAACESMLFVSGEPISAYSYGRNYQCG